MARPLRIENPEPVFPEASRGNGVQRVFFDARDRSAFLEAVSAGVSSYGLIVHAHGLMDNPYHLVIETPKGNLSRGKQRRTESIRRGSTAGRFLTLANDKGK